MTARIRRRTATLSPASDRVNGMIYRMIERSKWRCIAEPAFLSRALLARIHRLLKPRTRKQDSRLWPPCRDEATVRASSLQDLPAITRYSRRNVAPCSRILEWQRRHVDIYRIFKHQNPRRSGIGDQKKSVAVLPAFSSRQQLSLATKGTAPVWGPGPKGTLEFRKEARNQRRYVSRHLNSTQRLQFSLFQSAQ
jgi:hypothetical protein